MSDATPHEFHAPPPPPAPAPVAPRPTKLRIAGIVVFVIGLLILIGGIIKLLPGGILTGAVVAFFGLCLFGLGFVPLPAPAADGLAPMSTIGTLTGIFFEPTQVFRNLRRHPRWLAAFVIIVVLNLGYATAFTHRLTPERIVDYLTEKMGQTPFIPPEAVERAKVTQLEQLQDPLQRLQTALKSTVGWFVLYGITAALYLLGVLVFGGRMNYWQSFSMVLYSALPWVVAQKIISLIILYVKSPDDIHPLRGQETLVQDNLGFLFSPADHPVLFVTATGFGILSFYWLWLRATGLHNTGERVTKTAAWSVAILFWVLLLLLGIILAAIFPAFIS